MNMDTYELNAQSWNKVANPYQERFMDLDLYDDTYDAFCELLDTGARILEIGCGPGNITRYLLRKRPDLQILCTDIAPNMLELAKANNPPAEIMLLDGRDIDRLEGPYEAVLCGFCMPYLSQSDCEKMIGDSAALLGSQGILYFSVIEGDYADSGYVKGSTGDSMYLYYHEEPHLSSALQAQGFERLKLARKPYTTAQGQETVHLIFIARKRT